MKRIIAAIMLLLPIGASASIPEFTELAAKYDSNEQVTTIVVDKNLLAIAGGAESNAYIDKIDEVEMIMCDNGSLFEEIIKECDAIIKRYNAETMISVTEEEEQINVYAIKNGEKISNIILIINGSSSLAAVISGDIATNEIGNIIQVVGA